MDTEELTAKVKSLFSKGAKATKDVFEKTGDKVQDFTDKSVIKIEKHQLETKRDCKYEELGLKLSQMMIEGATINCSNPEDINILSDIQEEIKNLSDQIREKEKLI